MELARCLLIAAVALVASIAAEAALPAFPADSLAPLYGEWRNAMGRDPAPMNIDPVWMTSVGGQCPQRARYKVITVQPVTLENETNLEVTIHTYGEEFVGKKARETCSAQQLQRGGYVRFYFLDREEAADAPIGVFGWDACDTLDHLKQFRHPDVKGCTAGSIMDRVSKHVSGAAQKSEFYFGSWSAGGEAAMSIIGGDMQITTAYIKWSGSRSSPPCRTAYTVVERTTGTTKYPDEGWPESEIPNDIPYETVKIRLGKAKCLEGTAYMRLAMRADRSDHLDMVPYDSSNKPTGWFSFGGR